MDKKITNQFAAASDDHSINWKKWIEFIVAVLPFVLKILENIPPLLLAEEKQKNSDNAPALAAPAVA